MFYKLCFTKLEYHAGISVKGYPIQLHLTNGPMHIKFTAEFWLVFWC